MSEWAAKRFWKQAEVVPTESGYSIQLDGRDVKTPAKTLLDVPTKTLAEAICAEWDAQGEQINPLTMPMTRTANSALDKVRHQHGDVADMLAAYGDSDLICYRADGPENLVARQAEAWDPLVDFAQQKLGATLQPRCGIMHVPQDPAALATLSNQVHVLGAFELAAFHDLVALSGSLVIGFGAIHQYASMDSLWALSRIDEEWQIAQWGEDEDATAQMEVKQKAFIHAGDFYRLCIQN
ncbi:MAG: ATP12 family protein [Litoreibacter sp.]